MQLTLAQRQEIVTLHKDGWSQRSIAAHLKINTATVSSWVARAAQGVKSLANKRGSGRKPTHTAQQRKRIKQLARRGKTAVQIKAKEPYAQLSLSTITRIIKGGRTPLAWLPVVRGRALSAANTAARLAFCQGLSNTDGRQRISCDSKYFYLYYDQAGHMQASWQDPDRRVLHPAHPNPICLHVYAAITYGGKSKLVFVPPTRGVGTTDPNGKVTFKSEHFITAITELSRWADTTLPRGRRYTWLLDHAKQHTSAVSKAAIKDLGLQLEPNYPAQSYDLNPIEVAWGVLVGKLRGCRAKTLEGFKRSLIQAWESVPQSTINKLMESWGEHVRACAERGGKWPSKAGVV
jgi:transposase